MTKARSIANLLSTANGKIAGTNLDVSFENISDTGTEGTKVASGTTAQRGSTTGQWRYNTTTGYFEGRGNSGFATLEPDVTITSISPTTQTSASANIVVTGTNFTSGMTAKFIGNDGTEYASPSVTYNSATQLTITTPATALTASNEPYDVKVISSTGGKSGILENGLDAGGVPAWNTASGQIGGSLTEGDTVNITNVTASDPDGSTVTYSEVGSNLSGGGLSLNSSTGAITGTLPAVSSDTTYTFTTRASAGGDNTDRQFSIVNQNFSVTDINSIPENIWNSIPTGQFASASTYTDYYGGRFDVNSGNVMQFRSEFASEHVMYQRANSRSNSNEECYIQMYDISNDFGDASNGDQVCQFGIVEDDPTNAGYNNNTMFGYVSSSFTKSRYTVWGQSDVSSVHGFYTGGARATSSASIGGNSTNREVSGNYKLNEYQLNFTPTSASTRTAITFVIKPDNHSSNARKVYMYYGNTKVHTFANTIGANSTVHFYCGIGQATSSNGDFWTNNPPRIRFGDNNGSADYDVGG